MIYLVYEHNAYTCFIINQDNDVTHVFFGGSASIHWSKMFKENYNFVYDDLTEQDTPTPLRDVAESLPCHTTFNSFEELNNTNILESFPEWFI